MKCYLFGILFICIGTALNFTFVVLGIVLFIIGFAKMFDMLVPPKWKEFLDLF